MDAEPRFVKQETHLVRHTLTLGKGEVLEALLTYLESKGVAIPPGRRFLSGLERRDERLWIVIDEDQNGC
jgi:hypothetical protein